MLVSPPWEFSAHRKIDDPFIFPWNPQGFPWMLQSVVGRRPIKNIANSLKHVQSSDPGHPGHLGPGRGFYHDIPWYTINCGGIPMDTHGYQTLTKPFMLWSLFLPNLHGQDRQCLDWIWTLGQTQTLKHRFPAVDPTGICSILASNWMLRRVRFLCWGFCVCCSKSEFSQKKKIFVRCCPLADLGPSRDSEPLRQKTTWKCVGDQYYHRIP